MCGELPEVQRARLKIKAMRAFVRDLDVSLAQAEDALERRRKSGACPCQSNAQPQEAQRDHSQHLTAA